MNDSDHIILKPDALPPTPVACMRAAMEEIQADGLDMIRCSLTGAPYARLLEAEIRTFLIARMETLGNTTTKDALLDSWHLNLLSLSSNVSPVLRNQARCTLSALATSEEHGQARILTYCLARLFFPARTTRSGVGVTCEQAKARMLFAAATHDSLIGLDEEIVAGFVESFAACDTFLALSRWQESPLIWAKRANEGLHAPKNVEVKGWFIDPESMPVDAENLNRLAGFMLRLLVDMAGKEVPLAATGNQLMVDLFSERTAAIVHHSKPGRSLTTRTKASAKKRAAAISSADSQPDWYGAINKTSQAKFAWSATYGSGVKMGEKPVGRAPAKEKKPTHYKSAQARAMAAFGEVDFSDMKLD